MPEALSLPARVLGILVAPRATMRAVASRPRWIGVLVTTTAAAALAGALVMQTAVGRQALVDQWERTAIAFGQPMDDAAYARLQAASRFGSLYAVGVAVAMGPGVTFAVAGLLVAALGRRRTGGADAHARADESSGVRFRQVLAVVAHAGIILAARQIVAAPLTYLRETTTSALTIGVWFPMLDEGSAVAGFVWALDFFVIWWILILAIGIAVLYGRRARTIAPALLALFGVLALLIAAAMALS